MIMQRRHESLMSGEEIARVFNATEVRELEVRQAELETELENVHRKLETSEDVDEQEELQLRSEALRSEIRVLLSNMRTLQKKYSDSMGFNPKGK